MTDGHTFPPLTSEQASRRRAFALESRCAELELQMRQRSAEDDLRSFELGATQRELLLSQGYARHLEQELGLLHKHALAVADDRDRVAARMRELEREVAELGNMGGDTSASAGAVAIDRVLGRLRRFRPAWGLLRLGYRFARLVLRSARRLRRGLQRGGGRT